MSGLGTAERAFCVQQGDLRRTGGNEKDAPSADFSTEAEFARFAMTGSLLDSSVPPAEVALHADQDTERFAGARRARSGTGSRDHRGRGAAPRHSPAADRAPQPDAGQGADRDAAVARARHDALAERDDPPARGEPRVAQYAD